MQFVYTMTKVHRENVIHISSGKANYIKCFARRPDKSNLSRIIREQKLLLFKIMIARAAENQQTKTIVRFRTKQQEVNQFQVNITSSDFKYF